MDVVVLLEPDVGPAPAGELLAQDRQVLVRVRLDDDVDGPERPRRVAHGQVQGLLLAGREEERLVLGNQHEERAVGREPEVGEHPGAHRLAGGATHGVRPRIADHDDAGRLDPLSGQRSLDVLAEHQESVSDVEQTRAITAEDRAAPVEQCRDTAGTRRPRQRLLRHAAIARDHDRIGAMRVENAKRRREVEPRRRQGPRGGVATIPGQHRVQRGSRRRRGTPQPPHDRTQSSHQANGLAWRQIVHEIRRRGPFLLSELSQGRLQLRVLARRGDHTAVEAALVESVSQRIDHHEVAGVRDGQEIARPGRGYRPPLMPQQAVERLTFLAPT